MNTKDKNFEALIPEDIIWEYMECLFEVANIDELKKKHPNLFEKDSFILRVDVESGEVVNWDLSNGLCFSKIKVVDCGTYRLLNEGGDIISSYNGYVPRVLQIEFDGWDDYFEFCIYDNKHIHNWYWGEDVEKEIMNYGKYDD